VSAALRAGSEPRGRRAVLGLHCGVLTRWNLRDRTKKLLGPAWHLGDRKKQWLLQLAAACPGPRALKQNAHLSFIGNPGCFLVFRFGVE
jgi:hypothetical protein